ncbi:MAG: hypothetical protein RMI91_06440 [Gemmatales bacterium]|nr:hypothetical protein [Gemmatales bacterium]MDW7994274.1 hypothetical protein [Gemmatales bacterium]
MVHSVAFWSNVDAYDADGDPATDRLGMALRLRLGDQAAEKKNRPPA